MNRKGVTPVIAVVLLMTISVAATGAAYTFIINALKKNGVRKN
jgi:FlaG/FlaF family flagellin (archaellin)